MRVVCASECGPSLAVPKTIMTPQTTTTTEDTMTTTLTTGYVACDYLDGDTLDEVEHAPVRETAEQAADDCVASTDGTRRYDGLRYVHTDGHLYVDRPE